MKTATWMKKLIVKIGSIGNQINAGLSQVAIAIIKLYQRILSPVMGRQCRFYPTCSHYGEEAYRKHGFIYGTWLTLKRIVKCNPWHSGGFDYVHEHVCHKTTNDKTENSAA